MKSLALVMMLGCGNSPSSSSSPPAHCTCKPERDAVADSPALLAALRKHVRSVRDGRNARDIKVVDDELRLRITNLCTPCQVWVDDRARIDELYLLDRLDDASGAVCLGLVMHDGAIVYGEARPAACRQASSASSTLP